MGDSVMEQNLKAMEKWYPAFADLIRKEVYTRDEIQVETELSQDGETIFCVKKEERRLYLEGRRNAREPVVMWLERLGKIHSHAAVFLFGAGNGNYLKALAGSTQEDVNIVVYEPSVTIFLEMLRQTDLVETIESRPIAFIVEGINQMEFEPVMNKVLVLENLEFLKEELHPNYKELFGEDLLKYVKQLHSKVENMMVQYNTWKKLSINIAQNILRNMKYICEGYHTKKLSQVIPYSGPAILVSAGPSLNKSIRELKRAKNKAFILAVDTAIKPLVKEGILPDAFITIDANKPLSLIDIPGAENIPIVAPTCAMHELLKHQKGRKIFYFDGYMLPYYLYMRNGKQLPDVSSGGSVACSGLSLLYKMGFDTIVLVGQDLAFTDNKSHADGTFQEIMPKRNTENMLMVKGNYEDKVPTRGDFKLFIEWFNMYIEGMKKHRDVRVINATEGGAYIEGTELATLKETIDEVCREEIDFEACIRRMESDFNEAEREQAVEYLHETPEKFRQIYENARLLEKTYQKLQRLASSGTKDKNGVLKILKRIKKLTEKCRDGEYFQLIETSMPVADFVIRTEFFYADEDFQKEAGEVARKGIKYCQLMQECADMLKTIAEETLLPIT